MRPIDRPLALVGVLTVGLGVGLTAFIFCLEYAKHRPLALVCLTTLLAVLGHVMVRIAVGKARP